MKVKSGLDSDRVAFWEVDERHPDGEVYVAGDSVVEVGRTEGVLRALSRGFLVEVEGATKAKVASINATEAATELAAQRGIELHAIEGTGLEGRILLSDVEAAIDAGNS